jgi:hypothetical protein
MWELSKHKKKPSVIKRTRNIYFKKQKIKSAHPPHSFSKSGWDYLNVNFMTGLSILFFELHWCSKQKFCLFFSKSLDIYLDLNYLEVFFCLFVCFGFFFVFFFYIKVDCCRYSNKYAIVSYFSYAFVKSSLCKDTLWSGSQWCHMFMYTLVANKTKTEKRRIGHLFLC